MQRKGTHDWWPATPEVTVDESHRLDPSKYGDPDRFVFEMMHSMQVEELNKSFFESQAMHSYQSMKYAFQAIKARAKLTGKPVWIGVQSSDA